MRQSPRPLLGLNLTGKLPFGLFTSDDRFHERLEDLHRSVPSVLPSKRFFRH